MSESKPYSGDYQSPYDAPGERRGMSGCLKAFLILGGLGIAAMLACCVGSWVYMSRALVMEPPQVRDVANEILEWPFNEAMQGKVAARFFFARFAMMGDADKGFLMVADSKYADAENMGRDLEGRFEGQMQTDEDLLEDTELIEAGKREVLVKGETISLQFNRTRGQDSGKDYWEVVGVVPGKENPTFVMLKVLDEAFGEEEILRNFENIR